MTPYQLTLPARLVRALFFIAFAISVGVNPAWGGDSTRSAGFDALTRSGLEHYYNLEYDQAVTDLQAAVQLNPDDAKALNHLLEAILFRELYNHGALDTSLYTQQSFLNSKQITLDPAVKQQIKDLADKALALSEKRLKSNPEDVEALYARGVTRGLHSTYLGLVEHAWFSALRNALASRSDHEEVLRLRPSFTDAKTVVGIHNYVVANLPLPVKMMAGIGGIRGDKKKGLEYLAEAARSGGESSADANVALALFLRREERYDEALEVVRKLVQGHPRNFLFALEEANLLKDSGKRPEAIAAYQKLLEGCRQGKFASARMEMAEFSLADTLRAQGQLTDALQAYQAAGSTGSTDKEFRQKALVSAGEVSDLLTRREDALKQYRAAIALDSSSNEAEIARRYLSRPYREH